MASDKEKEKGEYIEATTRDWETNPRWKGIVRNYTAEQVYKIRGTLHLSFTLAHKGSEKLWKLLHTEPYVATLGALTGNQAVEMVQAGLKAIYVSGWQVAADMNEAFETYPDQSLYPADSAPNLVKRINNAFMRADQIQHLEGRDDVEWFVPILADGEAGFGGPLNVFEFMKAMIRWGAAGVHFEDQLSSYKKCGHLGGKVLVPTSQFLSVLMAARLASDVYNVPVLLTARTDANSASLISSDVDPADKEFIEDKPRTDDGFHRFRGGIDACISRGLSFAPYADMLWFETSTPDYDEAKKFAKAIHAKFPGKLLAYNCSPSFNWSKNLSERQIADFQKRLGELGYKFQFVTLAGFHLINHSMFDLAREYKKSGMSAYSEFQNTEFESAKNGYAAVKHQSFVGTQYFDEISMIISQGKSDTTALEGSTEKQQF
jgi:isocitrate lyase